MLKHTQRQLIFPHSHHFMHSLMLKEHIGPNLTLYHCHKYKFERSNFEGNSICLNIFSINGMRELYSEFTLANLDYRQKRTGK